MTIDERLDRLVERHEALTLSVELHDKQIGELTTLVTDISHGIARLLHVVEAHEQRLDSHEHRIDRLEQ